MGNIFDRFAHSPEEMAEVFEASRRAAAAALRDGRICACGHGARAHTSEAINSAYHESKKRNGKFACRPTKVLCPCQEFVAVLTTTNLRKFVYKGDGPGKDHALSKGIEASRDVPGIELDWLPETRCSICKVSGGALTAIGVDRFGLEVEGVSAYNMIVHPGCRGKKHIVGPGVE